MLDEWKRWTDEMVYWNDGDSFWDDLQCIKDNAFIGNGWLYIESLLYARLKHFVIRYDGKESAKHTKEKTELCMKHLLGGKYKSRTHKTSIRRLVINKRKKKHHRINTRNATRIIFIKK